MILPRFIVVENGNGEFEVAELNDDNETYGVADITDYEMLVGLVGDANKGQEA